MPVCTSKIDRFFCGSRCFRFIVDQCAVYIKKYNFAVRQFYEEYLYDKQGRIQFIYGLESDYGDVYQREYRFYFSQGRLIDVNIKSRANDGDTFNDVYNGKDVPKEYNSYYQDRMSSSKSIMSIFKTIDAAREM